MMDLELTTPPDEDDVLSLVSVADLKVNERMTHTQHDNDLLPRCIKSAYAALDGEYGWLNRSILTQSWTLYLSSFFDVLELPKGPVQSITSIKYYDADGVLQTLAGNQYELQKGKIVATVSKAYGVVWPTLDTRKRAVQIEYVTGFGDSDTIPFPMRQKLQQAIIFLASHYYRNPSATYAEPRVVVVNRKLEMGLEHLIGFLRIPPDHS